MTNPITCDQVHQALVDSIELRWKPLKAGALIDGVPGCQLCFVFRGGITLDGFSKPGCKGCPLYLTGNSCHLKKSSWQIWQKRKSSRNAQHMIDALQLCLDTYFKEWKK